MDPLTLTIAKRTRVSAIRKLDPYNDAEADRKHERMIDTLTKCRDILANSAAHTVVPSKKSHLRSRRKRLKAHAPYPSAPSQDKSTSLRLLVDPTSSPKQQAEVEPIHWTKTSLTAASRTQTTQTQVPSCRESTPSRPRLLDSQLSTTRAPSDLRPPSVNERIPESSQPWHTSQHALWREEEVYSRAHGTNLGSSSGGHPSYHEDDDNGYPYSKTRKAILFLTLFGVLWKFGRYLVTGWSDSSAPKKWYSLLSQKLSELDWSLPRRSYTLLSQKLGEMNWALPKPHSVLPQRLGELDWVIPQLSTAVSQKLAEMNWLLPKESYTVLSQKLGEFDRSVLKDSYSLLLRKVGELGLRILPISGTETERLPLEVGIRSGLQDVISFVRGSQS